MLESLLVSAGFSVWNNIECCIRLALVTKLMYSLVLILPLFYLKKKWNM
jgi:hypothetical protein